MDMGGMAGGRAARWLEGPWEVAAVGPQGTSFEEQDHG